MSIPEIPNAELDYGKRLANIGVQIATGRAELAKIAEDKEQFLSEREKDVAIRVAGVLIASKQALDEAYANYVLLGQYEAQVTSFAADITKIYDDLVALAAEVDAKIPLIYKGIDAKMAELAKITQEQAIQKGIIAAGVKQMAVKEAGLKTLQKQVTSQQQVLTNAFQEARKRNLIK